MPSAMLSPPAIVRALALLLLLAAPALSEAKKGKAKSAAAPPAAAPATASQPAKSQGWTPVLRQKQKQCRARHQCSLDPRAPACAPCRGI